MDPLLPDNQSGAAPHGGLDALIPAQVAVIDPTGRVLAANAPWLRHAAAAEPRSLVRGAPGDNVVELWQRSSLREGPAAAAGLRELLSGSEPSWDYVYPADAAGYAWRLVRAVRRSDGPGLVLLHIDLPGAPDPSEPLRTVLAAVPTLIWQGVAIENGHIDLEWQVDAVNPAAAARFTSAAAGEGRALMAAWRNAIPQEERERVDAWRDACVRAGRPVHLEYPLRRDDGQYTWIAEDVTVTRSGVGRWNAVGVCVDASELRKREQDAVRAAEGYESVFADAPLPMLLVEAATLRVVEANGAAREVYGYDEAAIEGLRFRDLRAPDPETGPGDLPADAIEAHTRADGERIEMRVRSVRTHWNGKPAFLVVAENVTERRRLENQLLQAEKLDLVGKIASGLAHDFNNSLTAIMGLSGLAELELPLDHPAVRHLQSVQEAATRAADLVRQLLAFARRQVIEPRTLNVNGLLLDVDNLLVSLLGARTELVSLPRADVGAVRVDPVQFKQVVIDIADFARGRMPAGGKFLIETDNVSVDADFARRHRPMTAGDYVLISCSDTGDHLPDLEREQLFEPFFSPGGFGMGLATCYGIVKQSGGFIWTESREPTGLTFRIYLPRVADEAVQAEREREKTSGARGPETVLIVEDDSLVRSAAVQTLRSLGYSVLEAGSVRDAVRAARAHGSRIDLVVTDVDLPMGTGAELVEKLRETWPDIEVLYITGHDGEELARITGDAGAVRVLQKPFSLAALGDAVRLVLDRSAGRAGAFAQAG